MYFSDESTSALSRRPGGFVIQMKLMSTFFAEQKFSDEITWITSNDNENLEICPFLRWGQYLSNERGFSAESSLEGILANLFLQKQKKLVGSNVIVISTRQTCGQHSCMSAGSKGRALAIFFSVRSLLCVCYVF